MSLCLKVQKNGTGEHIPPPRPKQGLTLVPFSAQLERIFWDRGARRVNVARVKGVSGGVEGVHGVFECFRHGSS